MDKDTAKPRSVPNRRWETYYFVQFVVASEGGKRAFVRYSTLPPSAVPGKMRGEEEADNRS